uniref:Protein Tat n=1 Tax=Simian immunodeficiency virus TaxID=11723 RepID=Q6VG46_SIV|nr:tat protein [Simian immunodeficiency virus]
MDPSVEELPKEQRPGAAPATPCTSCFCKKCAFHCVLCFQKKALGISYGRRFRKRSRADSSLPSHSDPVQIKGRATLPFLLRSLSDRRRDQKRQKEQKETVEAEAETDP